MHINLPIAVHVFVTKGDQILLIKRVNTGFNDNKWSVPAGRLEEGESITQAAIREVKEEVGLSIKNSNLGLPLIMHYKNLKGEKIYVFFKVNKWSGNIKNMELDKCSEVKWFSKKNLPKALMKHIEYSLFTMEKGLPYVEYGFKKKLTFI